jgi:hypothetical protein
MEGVWSWADHIQAIYSERPILQSTKLLRQPEKNSKRMKIWWMKSQCLQDEGADCSSHRMRAFVWDLKVP